MTPDSPRNNIVKRVNNVLVTDFELEAGQLTPEAKLFEDLGLDSLDALDLIVMIEKEFGQRMEDDEARAIRTLGDVYDYIESKWLNVQP